MAVLPGAIMLKFNHPTLITLTAPSCAGKSFLLEELVTAGCNRIVSTTDRMPRKGEIEGTHYFFIDTPLSMSMEEIGQFAELVTYNGVRYGVTHQEMETKMADGRPPIVILEPQGVEIYRKYCGSKGWSLFSVYVETQESIRLERLVRRTSLDIAGSSGGYDDIHKIVAANNKRLKAILEQERSWGSTNRWDAIVDGTNIEKAMASIEQGIKYRNSRPEMYA